MSDVAYKSLLFEIGQQLSQHDHQQLLEMCRLDDEADNIRDARSLIKRLEEKNRLGIDRLGDLEEVLTALDESSALLEKLKEFEKKRKEYQNLLAQISRALDSDERNHLEQITDICKRETSLELDENISNIRKLFEDLEKKGCLGFRNLDFLKEILREIEKEDLLREIEEYEQRRNENDASERRKAKWYSRAKAIVTKAKQVDIKMWCLVGRKLLNFAEMLANWDSIGHFLTSFGDRVLPTDTELTNVGRGSVCFTVQANSLEGLTTLWNMYQDGTLKARLYNFLVTDEVRNRAEAEENVELTVKIEEEEYERAFIDLNNEVKGDAQVQGRKREHSDSVLSTMPNEDETLRIKVKRLEDDVKLLKGRVDSQEKQMISGEEVQEAGYKGLGNMPCNLDEYKWNLTKLYMDSLQLKTPSLMTETTIMGMRAKAAPSEFSVDMGGQYPKGTVTYDKRNSQTVKDEECDPLSLAVQSSNFAVVEDMLSRGVDINTKNKNGDTALIMAALSCKKEAVNYLLDKGADPMVKGRLGRNLLHSASQGGNVAIIETVMSRGLDVDSQDSKGNTPLMVAAAFGKIEALHNLLKKGADPSIKNQFGRNSLHSAAEGGNVTIIETLMPRGLDIDSRDSNGNTPLMVAAGEGNIEAVNYLLDKGADPLKMSRFGGTLLHFASYGGNVAIVEKMLSFGLDVNSKEFRGLTPLEIAKGNGKTEAVNFLLSEGGR